MKTFRNAACDKIFSILFLLLLLSGCDHISQGSQRKKFEFLYKMSNYASLFREYNSNISYGKDIDFYQDRIPRFREDISKIVPIDSYRISNVLKEKFLSLISDNLKTAQSLKEKNFPPNENIRKEYDVIVMNERVENFIIELNDEITTVGRE